MSLDVDRFCRTLLRDAADAVIYADAEGLIGFWNKGAERIFGFSESEALEKSLDHHSREPAESSLEGL